MKIKYKLQECIPNAYYSNGTESKCLIYRIFNMFDIDSQSFKEVKIKVNMDKKNKESNSAPVWGPEFNGRTGKLLQS